MSRATSYHDNELLLTNAMLFHEGNEVGFGEQLGWTGLPIHHLHSAGLKAGASLIDRKGLRRAAEASVKSLCHGTWAKDNFQFKGHALLHLMARVSGIRLCSPRPEAHGVRHGF